MTKQIQKARTALMAEGRKLQAALKTDKTRARGEKVRLLHDIRRMLDPGYRYSSQAGQDVVVDRLMNGKRGGTFLDIGGYDGVTGSNTLFLEMFRGWRGALVEPVATHLDAARTVRRCACLGVAVAAQDGHAEFIEITEGYTQMSGLAASYDPSLLETVRADPRHGERRHRVKTRTLASILTKTGLETPDFISLDIEGGELAVLETFPFDRHRVGIWAIENNSADPRIARIMRDHGYELAEFCGPDEIYRLAKK